MGHELRRVPLDFDWPLNKVWHGFLNPHYLECWCCDGRGQIIAMTYLDDFVRKLIVLGEASAERPEDFKRPGGLPLHDMHSRMSTLPKRWPFKDDPAEVLEGIIGEKLSEEHAWMVRRVAHVNQAKYRYYQTVGHYVWEDGVRKVRMGRNPTDPMRTLNYPHPYILEDGIGDPTPDFHEVVRKIPGVRPESFLGWSGGWNVLQAISEELDLDENWWKCPRCGHQEDASVDPTVAEAYNSWKKEEPPEGEGWQLWETVSEGSPVTPVFKTAEELAQHLVDKGDAQDFDATVKWLVEKGGWAMSAVSGPGIGVQSGVQFMTQKEVPGGDG